MSARHSVALALTLAVALAAVGVRASDADDGKEERHPSRPFKHPYIVATIGAQDATAALQDATVAKLGDRSFLVGTSLGGNWYPKGTTTWIPVDEIHQLAEFEELESVGNVVRLQ